MVWSSDFGLVLGVVTDLYHDDIPRLGLLILVSVWVWSLICIIMTCLRLAGVSLGVVADLYHNDMPKPRRDPLILV